MVWKHLNLLGPKVESRCHSISRSTRRADVVDPSCRSRERAAAGDSSNKRASQRRRWLEQDLDETRVPRAAGGLRRTWPTAVVAHKAYTSGMRSQMLRALGVRAAIPEKIDRSVARNCRCNGSE